MKLPFLFVTTFATLILGCASSTPESTPAVADIDTRFFNCQLPTIADDRGPIRPSLFVVGTFAEGPWIHMDNHKMAYKGDGIYQVVSQETAGNVSLQFATMSWTPQFTAAGKTLTVGEVKELKRGGFAKDTVVTIPSDGRYVWTIQIAPDKAPLLAAIAQCQ